MKHFVCRICGNLVAMLNDSGKRIGCCGRNMEEVVPNVSEGAREKHLPNIKIDGNRVTVTVGEEMTPHPQETAHAITWVALVTTGGNQRKMLKPSGKPSAEFMLAPGERVVKAFAYCNLHGLWVTEAK